MTRSSRAGQDRDQANNKDQPYAALRRRVLARDGWRCQDCGAMIRLEVHHQRFRSHGGQDDERNLITLCRTCHRQRHESRTR